ncbi:MAG: hypothetical protein ACU0AZ_08520 [Paracoccaceae bacterium]|jgi:hypothetical protein
MGARWHIQRDATGLTLARALPARFDVSAETVLPLGDPLLLAHQIRQDMWRALQNLRGFSPVVRIDVGEAEVQVIAGGRVSGRVPATTVGRIAEVLETPANRQRWQRYACRKGSVA